MTADRPTTEPRTEAPSLLDAVRIILINEVPSDEAWRDLNDAYDAAMAEAAQGAGPLDERRRAAYVVSGLPAQLRLDFIRVVAKQIGYEVIRSEGAAPRAEGLDASIRELHMDNRHGNDLCNDLHPAISHDQWRDQPKDSERRLRLAAERVIASFDWEDGPLPIITDDALAFGNAVNRLRALSRPSECICVPNGVECDPTCKCPDHFGPDND